MSRTSQVKGSARRKHRNPKMPHGLKVLGRFGKVDIVAGNANEIATAVRMLREMRKRVG